MNAVEHIAEAYYRICRNCFTIADKKVPNGNNRQFDLLAIHVETGRQFHIESSVKGTAWRPRLNELKLQFDKKFLGHAQEKEGANTDHMKGKTYEVQIRDAYKSVGFNWDKVCRIWCCWDVAERESLDGFLKDYKIQTGLTVEMLFFPDVLAELIQAIGTANYEDPILRTLSLIKQLNCELRDKPGLGDMARFESLWRLWFPSA